MFAIKFEMPKSTCRVTSRERSLDVDLAKLSPAMLANLFSYGISQKIGDAASAAAQAAGELHFGSAKAEVNKADWAAWAETDRAKEQIADQALLMMQKAVDALYRGDWQIRIANGTSQPTDPVQKLAHDMAKAVLLATFKNATKKVKLADIAAAHEKIGEFFVTKGEGDKAKVTWNEARVADWIAKQADEGKRDYRAEAAEAIDGADADIDLDALDI